MSEEPGIYKVRNTRFLGIRYYEDDGDVFKQFDYPEDGLIKLRKDSFHTKVIYSTAGDDLFRTDERPSILKKRGNESFLGYWMTLLSYYTEYQTNRLVKLTGDSKNIYDLIPIALTIDEITEVLITSKRTMYRFLSLCDEHHLIKKYNNEYYCNPYYGYKGAGVSPVTVSIFSDCKKLKRVLSKDDAKVISMIREKWEILESTTKSMDKDSTWCTKQKEIYSELENKIKSVLDE